MGDFRMSVNNNNNQVEPVEPVEQVAQCKNYSLRESVNAVGKELDYSREYLGNFTNYIANVSQEGGSMLGRQQVKVAVNAEQAGAYAGDMQQEFNKIEKLSAELLAGTSPVQNTQEAESSQAQSTQETDSSAAPAA